MWSESCSNEVNRQINMEYSASYAYDYLSSYFDRNSVGLKGVAAYFRKASDEEREHAHKLIAYQNMRGGEVVLKDIVLVSGKKVSVGSKSVWYVNSHRPSLSKYQNPSSFKFNNDFSSSENL